MAYYVFANSAEGIVKVIHGLLMVVWIHRCVDVLRPMSMTYTGRAVQRSEERAFGDAVMKQKISLKFPCLPHPSYHHTPSTGK